MVAVKGGGEEGGNLSLHAKGRVNYVTVPIMPKDFHK